MKMFWMFLAAIWFITGLPLRAGGGPENVMVVVNGDSWTSRAVANEFIQLREIPPANVIYLHGLPDLGVTPVKTFRDRILKPVLATIDRRRLRKQIDYMVYSTDFPYGVDVRADHGGKKLPRVLTPTASINGLTYLYQQVLAEDVNYLQLDSNRYMRRPLRSLSLKRLNNKDVQRIREAIRLMNQKKWAEAAMLLSTLAKMYPSRPGLHYIFARCLARQDKGDLTIAALGKAVTAGWANSAQAKNEADLESVRDRKDFLSLLKAMDENRKKTFDVQPTLGFHNRDGWNQRGEKIATKEGRRHLLSTTLAVTSGRGNSVSEAVAALRRSASADYTSPQGTIYYLVNGNIRSRTRQPAFPSAVARLKRLGVKAEIIKGVLPQGKQDVMGAMIGTASFRWPSSRSKILPGAICEHLTSYGGVMREAAGQTPLTEFIRAGAAASSGTVAEPFAIQAKFPFAFLHVHYAHGCSAAEAFYQSVAGPYQLLVVGDPLCQPWARPMKVSAIGIKADATVSGVIRFGANVTEPKGKPLQKGRLEIFLDGRRTATIALKEQSAIDTRKLPDGYHEVRIVAIRGDAIETQSRVVLPLNVNNHGYRVSLSGLDSGKINWGKMMRIRASAKGAKSIDVMHNSRTLGTISGSSGHFDIKPLDVGPGPVQIFAVAKIEGQSVSSKPVVLTVVPPKSFPSVRDKTKPKTKPGLLLTIGKNPATTIQSTRDRRWLAKLGGKSGDSFSLDSEFPAARSGVYQIQLRSSCPVSISIDGRSVFRWSRKMADRWQFVPVHLQKGNHRFQLKGTATKNPRIEIRFGDRGAQSLDGKRFGHSP